MKTNDKIILVAVICIFMVSVAYAGYATGSGEVDIPQLVVFLLMEMIILYLCVGIITKESYEASDKKSEQTCRLDVFDGTMAIQGSLVNLEARLRNAIDTNNEKLLKKLDENKTVKKHSKKENKTHE